MQVIHFRRPIGHPKGRPIEAAARDSVRALLGAGPLRRDLLIEYLHRLQDAQGSLPVSLLTALAEAMRLAPAEVYEVASFYHHFDVLADGETPPPSLTVRVCESLSCTMNGAGPLLASLREQPATRSGCSRCLWATATARRWRSSASGRCVVPRPRRWPRWWPRPAQATLRFP
jgi:NADH:ubiquinone oxidoreductase subunit E